MERYPVFNADLEKEFQQMGFSNYQEMLGMANDAGCWDLFHCDEIVKNSKGHKIGWADFEFYTLHPELGKPTIESIHLKIEADYLDEVGITVSLGKHWSASDWPMPTKEGMINELLKGKELLIEKLARIHKVRDTFNLVSHPSMKASNNENVKATPKL
jgi:hypothetical protein